MPFRIATFCLAAVLLAAPYPALAAQSGAVAAAAAAVRPAPVLPVPAEKLAIAGVSNAGKVNDSLFRGAQPKPEGFAELQKLGITLVVNLRSEHREVEWERKQVESLGLRYVNIPIGGFATPKEEQVAQFLTLFRQSAGQKIFVHCHYGEDRTGVMIATYRIAAQKWSADQAVQEMHSFGFRGFWHPAMESYVRKFPVTYSADPAFAPLRSPAISH